MCFCWRSEWSERAKRTFNKCLLCLSSLLLIMAIEGLSASQSIPMINGNYVAPSEWFLLSASKALPWSISRCFPEKCFRFSVFVLGRKRFPLERCSNIYSAKSTDGVGLFCCSHEFRSARFTATSKCSRTKGIRSFKLSVCLYLLLLHAPCHQRRKINIVNMQMNRSLVSLRSSTSKGILSFHCSAHFPFSSSIPLVNRKIALQDFRESTVRFVVVDDFSMNGEIF